MDQRSIHTQTSLNESGSCPHPKQVYFTLAFQSLLGDKVYANVLYKLLWLDILVLLHSSSFVFSLEGLKEVIQTPSWGFESYRVAYFHLVSDHTSVVEKIGYCLFLFQYDVVLLHVLVTTIKTWNDNLTSSSAVYNLYKIWYLIKKTPYK